MVLLDHTTLPAFRDGNAEAPADEWFWSSTQYSAHLAWGQFFNEGCQIKESAGWAVAVRKVKVYRAASSGEHAQHFGDHR
jgi:hypothetical protein